MANNGDKPLSHLGYITLVLVEIASGMALAPLVGIVGMMLMPVDPQNEKLSPFDNFFYAAEAGAILGVVVCDLFLFRLNWRVLIGLCTGGLALWLGIQLLLPVFHSSALVLRIVLVWVFWPGLFAVGFHAVFLFGNAGRLRRPLGLAVSDLKDLSSDKQS